MSKDFIPGSDSLLLPWSTTFSAGITDLEAAIGVTSVQAAAYAALHTAFASALATSSDPATRTRGTVAAKNDARKPLVAMARDLARIIQAYPGVTDTQRIDLGLTVAETPSPINAPTESPVLEVVSANGRLLKLRLHALDSNRRGKPEGVDGATIFSFVGSAPPADITLWKFEGSTTRTTFDVEFEPTVPAGSQVWLTAFWFNPRSVSGPACTPISAYLAGGVVGAIAA